MVIAETQPEKHIPEIHGPDRTVERKIHLRRKYARLPEGERHFAAQPAVSASRPILTLSVRTVAALVYSGVLFCIAPISACLSFLMHSASVY